MQSDNINSSLESTRKIYAFIGCPTRIISKSLYISISKLIELENYMYAVIHSEKKKKRQT